jgi:hypothetical protein
VQPAASIGRLGAGNGAGNIEFGVGGMCRGKSTMFVGAIEAGTGVPN